MNEWITSPYVRTALRRNVPSSSDASAYSRYDSAPREVANLGLEPRKRGRCEAPQGAVVVRRLARVADPELDVVDALERQEVLRLRIGILVDNGARLVERALAGTRDRLGHKGLKPPCRWVPLSYARLKAESSSGFS